MALDRRGLILVQVSATIIYTDVRSKFDNESVHLTIAVLQTEHGLSERRACNAVRLQRSVYHYVPRPNADGPIVKLLLELAWQRSEQGFAKLFRRLEA